LAVALGIGTALANSPGLAAAEDGTSSVSDSRASSDAADSSTTTGSTDTTQEADDHGTADGDEEPDDTEELDEEPDQVEQLDENAGERGSPQADGDEDEDDDGDDDDSNREPERSQLTDASTSAPEEKLSGLSIHVDTAPADEPAPGATATVSTATASTASATTAPVTSTTTLTQSAPAPTPATVTTPVQTLVASLLSAFGLGPQAANGPAAPAQSPMLWAMLGWALREIGTTPASSVSVAAAPTAALVAEAADTVSPLATPQQLAAERIATATANSLPVAIMRFVLRQQFLATARNLYGTVDADNMAALDRAVNEYAMAAAFQQQLLDSMNPKVVTQVAPPHVWFGQSVPGSRILYDNPDTIYRFMGVNGASEYVITGRFHDNAPGAERPTDVTFSVLEGLAGTTSSLLTLDDLEVNEDGTFVITVSREPANGRPNHLQLTSGSTIIAARDTLGDWNSEVPMSLSIQRVGGPPNSMFAQIGGFAFLGQFVSGNPLLTSLVSIVPPLPYMPPLLRGIFTAAILVVRGANEQAKYMALATHDPETGAKRPVNTVSQPSSNAEFLANQLQSNGHFQLADGQALVLTIDPGDAEYFVVPAYDIWTITHDYWNQPGSLNNAQAKINDDNRTYTVVISPTDPGAANWISTDGLNRGTLAIRFQGLPANVTNPPRIVDQRVLTHAELLAYLPADDFVTPEQRAAQLAERKDGFDNRWAPYPQP
jgi:hypothetical protein